MAAFWALWYQNGQSKHWAAALNQVSFVPEVQILWQSLASKCLRASYAAKFSLWKGFNTKTAFTNPNSIKKGSKNIELLYSISCHRLEKQSDVPIQHCHRCFRHWPDPSKNTHAQYATRPIPEGLHQIVHDAKSKLMRIFDPSSHPSWSEKLTNCGVD